MKQPVFRRILLKLSGEALSGDKDFGIDDKYVINLCRQIKAVHDLGVQIGIVVGGGNFWRGRSSAGMNRVTADHMGMLATTMNSLALSDSLQQLGVEAIVMGAVEIRSIVEANTSKKAIDSLNKGCIVIFAGGTGNPFFSTDTAAALRAAEIEAEVVFKATNVDGVYDSDPKCNPAAKRYERLTHDDVLRLKLGVMDATAAALCRDNQLKIAVFSLQEPYNIMRMVCGENIGTLVC